MTDKLADRLADRLADSVTHKLADRLADNRKDSLTSIPVMSWKVTRVKDIVFIKVETVCQSSAMESRVVDTLTYMYQ